MNISAATDRGLVREINEDSYFAGEIVPGFVLLAVADGLGGHEAGEVASKMAIEGLKGYLQSFNVHQQASTIDYASLLTEAFHFANRLLYEAASSQQGLDGMGTTLTAALVVGNKAFIAHVGDSRVYLLRDGGINQITNDHSLVGELIKNNRLTEEEALHHPHKHILTNALGTESQARVDSTMLELRPGDMLVLCTDGLTNLVDKTEIAEIIQSSTDYAGSVRTLINVAKSRGGYDNVTVVLAGVPGL